MNKEIGYIQKRTISDPAIIRYPRFSEVKSSEKYYYSILQLFLPHYSLKSLMPNKYKSYKEFYFKGKVIHNNKVQLVKTVVNINKEKFEKNISIFDEAEKLDANSEFLEDAWARMFSENEAEKLDSLLEKEKVTDDNMNVSESIPDLSTDQSTKSNIEHSPLIYNKSKAMALL